MSNKTPINEADYLKMLQSCIIVNTEFDPESGLQTLHLDDGCMIQIEDGKMRLFNRGGAMLFSPVDQKVEPEPAPEPPMFLKIEVGQTIEELYTFTADELPDEVRADLQAGDSESFQDWFLNLEVDEMDKHGGYIETSNRTYSLTQADGSIQEL
jgi:hypothetical protein